MEPCRFQTARAQSLGGRRVQRGGLRSAASRVLTGGFLVRIIFSREPNRRCNPRGFRPVNSTWEAPELKTGSPLKPSHRGDWKIEGTDPML
jgi:hypothetical protein